MATSRYTFDLFIRRQVELEGLKASFVEDFEETVQDIDKELVYALTLLGVDYLNQLPAQVFENLVERVNEIIRIALSKYTDNLDTKLQELARNEAEFTVQAFIESLSEETQVAVAPPEAPWHFASTMPVQAGGLLLLGYMEEVQAKEFAAFEGLIRTAYIQGWSLQQTLTAIRGTRGRNFTDGMMAKLQRDMASMTRTSVQHVSNTSRFAVYQANSGLVVGYRWVSVLDNRTTPVCRSLDGEVFEIGKGPLPPIHPNCRSTTMPEFVEDAQFREGTRPSMTGSVPAGMTYYQWLREQPEAFQDSVLGPTRGRLLRNGGLSAEEFARLNLGRTFHPLTLEEMRQRWPQVFSRAGL